MIDILLATYNGEEYLADQLDSILSQTNESWRLIIHDDGSTDNTIGIVKNYQQCFPDKIDFIEDKIITGSAKQNFLHLMSLSEASYVMFCDQDDVWLKDKVQLSLDAMKQAELKNSNLPIVVHSDLTIVDCQKKIVADSMFKYQGLEKENNSLLDLLAKNNVTGCTMMINRLACNASLPVSSKAIMHDWWIASRVMGAGGKIYFIDEPTILYRQHDNNCVGAVKVGLWHYSKKLLNLKAWFRSYSIMKDVMAQAEAVDPNVKAADLFRKKIVNIFMVLFRSIPIKKN